MAAPNPTVPAISLPATLGALLMGVLFSAFVYGISTLHGIFYLHKFHHHDPWAIKLYVGFIWLMDTGHLLFAIWALYHYVVYCFGNPLALLRLHWAFKMLTILSVLIINSVQGFYLHRVWRLSGLKSRIMVFVAGLSVLCGFAFGLMLAVKTAQSQSFLELQRRDLMIAAEASFSIATASDFAIAGAMCYYLWSSKKTVPHLRGSRLHVAINNVIQYTICSGLLTSLTSLACLITFITLPHTLIFFAVSFLLTKCYVVSLFTLLNLRRGNNLTPDQTKAGESSNSYSMGFRRNVSHHLDSAVDRAPVMGVHVDVERSATADPVLDLTGSVKISAFQISDELDHKASQW